MNIIRRSTWGAKPSSKAYEPHFPKKITVHHQGASDKDPKAHTGAMFDGAKTLRSIQKFHMEGRGWSDIGYHFIIAPNGEVYEGRPADKKGAHVLQNNTGNIGIMVVGNFEVETPTKDQINSLKDLILELKNQFPQLDIPKCIFGHKDFNPTDCPGTNLYPVVNDIKWGKNSLYVKD